jgi:hypothetical protein
MKTMQNPAGFRTVFTGSMGINLKQQNRTDHLLQKPDIFICYRQTGIRRESDIVIRAAVRPCCHLPDAAT